MNAPDGTRIDEQEAEVPKDECRRCHVTMHLPDGDDPEELCHSCAYEELREKDQTITELQNQLAGHKLYIKSVQTGSENLESENQELRELVEGYRTGHGHKDCLIFPCGGKQVDERCDLCILADAPQNKEPKP
jgi:hypothetical protein